MQPPSTNGAATSARAMLESLRQVIEQLEAELQKQREEVKQLRAERDDYRAVVYEHLKKKFDPKVWENFNPDEYTVTIDDLLADLKEMTGS